jgi:hypothetical protein
VCLVFRLRACDSGRPLNTIMNHWVHKMRVNSWGAEGLSVVQCGFCPVHLVCYLLIALLPGLFIGGFGYFVARGTLGIFVFRYALRSRKERLIWRPYPSAYLSVCLWPNIGDETVCQIFLAFRNSLKKPNKHKFNENGLSDCHTLLGGINEILLLLSYFLI